MLSLNLAPRLGISLHPRQSHNRWAVELDRHWLRPNELLQISGLGFTLSVYWPRKGNYHA